jgi:hypothetical protein
MRPLGPRGGFWARAVKADFPAERTLGARDEDEGLQRERRLVWWEITGAGWCRAGLVKRPWLLPRGFGKQRHFAGETWCPPWPYSCISCYSGTAAACFAAFLLGRKRWRRRSNCWWRAGVVETTPLDAEAQVCLPSANVSLNEEDLVV